MRKIGCFLFLIGGLTLCRIDNGCGQTVKDVLKPAVKEGGFKMKGFILWCPTVILVDKTYHMFASRWPEEYGLEGWTTHSEIVRATSDNLLGPYTFQEVVLKKRDGFWDSERAHNPRIIKSGDTYVLYYISTANETGYAFSKSITGPWKRSDSAVMNFSNPAPVVRPDGSVYIFGRKSVNGVRIAQAYSARSFEGPYSLLKDGNNLLPGLNQLEDPTIWLSGNQYNVVLSDFKGDVTGMNKNGAQYFSENGIDYKVVSPEPVYTRNVIYDDQSRQTFKRRERPFVFVNGSGEPAALFTACLTPEGKAWIVAQPILKRN